MSGALRAAPLPAAWGVVRDLPFPAALHDEAWRIVDCNEAYAAYLGRPREALLGRDPADFLHPDDRAATQRDRAGAWPVRGSLVERRVVDAEGRLRHCRAARRPLADGGRRFMLVTLQDTTAEVVARERADGSARELDDWFELSPLGMLLFDEGGLLVRHNPAFERLVGALPVSLADADPWLQQLLGWREDGPPPPDDPAAAPRERHGLLPVPGAGLRPLRAVLRTYRTPGGARRTMAVIEDRSAEEERDLAQLQLGAMIGTAGVGVATFREAGGWVQPAAPAGSGGDDGGAALQAIGRDLVLPESIAAYDALQRALKKGERAELRYAIRHPQLGLRWLVTRVEPAALSSGRRTTSVVTLDVTEQERARRRAEALLRELTQVLESTPAGIAHLRDGRLVRCNGRFEAMLGLAPGEAAGAALAVLFAHEHQRRPLGEEIAQALAGGPLFETEFDRCDGAGGVLWYALSVRRVDGEGSAGGELIAVLSDITRLRQQQRQLEELARERELMFNLSDIGIAWVRDGRIQRANDALAQLTGWPVAELAGLEVARLAAEADQQAAHWQRQQHELVSFGRWSGEHQLRRRDGRAVWVQAGLRLVADGDPSLGHVATYVDVDARYRAERVVALQVERTRAILDSALVGIVTVGADGIEWMNRSARRMFGGGLADFVGRPIDAVAGDEPDHPFRRTHYLESLEEGQAETFECRVQALDGRLFWVVGNVVATAREGRGRQLTYALLDIERRRQAEARMSEAQASLQRIIEAAPMAIILSDARTLRVLQANQVAAEVFGRTPQAMVGALPEDLFAPADAAVRRADMELTLSSRTLQQREYHHDGAGGAAIWDARYLPLAARDPADGPDQLLLVATDVTAQRAAQEARLEAAIAQREMLVKEVHHRIKNNLQGVAGLLQQIAQRRPEVASVMSEVIGQVQAIAQVYGLQVGATGPLRISTLVQAITGSVQRTFGRTIHCGVDGPAAEDWTLPEAESIPTALTLNELLTNAIKHSQCTPVDCRVRCDDEGVRLVIANVAQLPPGFSLAGIPGGVSGLGLVRALLPRRGASLAIEQAGAQVEARIVLKPPCIARLSSP